jgi:hypothetical protein
VTGDGSERRRVSVLVRSKRCSSKRSATHDAAAAAVLALERDAAGV